MKSPSFVAVDLGAESGRVILGTLNGEQIQLEEVHRFSNGGVRLGENLHWDVLHLWQEIKVGLSLADKQSGGELRSIGLDTWGVDFGLLDVNDNLIGNPYHYRDSRTDGMMDAVLKQIPHEEVYAQTGIQFMQINSLYQLYSMIQAGDPALSIARTFLNMPDLFNFFLTGEKASEFSIATTTQCYNPLKQTWAFDLLTALGIPTNIFREIISSGTVLGELRSSLAGELGLGGIPVVASAGHDTACAVAAVPASSPEYIYLSSGTWSLMGVELDDPMIDTTILEANLTNEGGVGGKIRFLKNIVGLWLLQECRRIWSQNGLDYDYNQLTRMAIDAPAFGPLVDPSDQRFLAPDDMVAAIQSYCRDTGQAIPMERGTIVRCIIESLALEYRRVAEQISQLTGSQYSVIHIIGGGSQNQMLNQLAANATGRKVVAGPVEATAVGNILVQAMAVGEIATLGEGRSIVRKSFPLVTYQPEDAAAWDETFEHYSNLRKK